MTDAEQRPPVPASLPEATSPKPWFRRRHNLIALGVAVHTAAGTAIGITLAARGPGTITVDGTLSVGGMANDNTNAMSPVDSDPCTSIGDHRDIGEGTTVTIGGSTGQVLMVTGLSAGVETDLPAGATIATRNCVFSSSAPFPAGQPMYTVTIGHRGSQTFTPGQAQAGVSLALG